MNAIPETGCTHDIRYLYFIIDILNV